MQACATIVRGVTGGPIAVCTECSSGGRLAARSFAMLLDGRAQPTGIRRKGIDRTLLVMINAHHERVPFMLPSIPGGDRWRLLIDTNQPLWARRRQLNSEAAVDISGRSLTLWELQPPRSLKTNQDEALAEFVTGAPTPLVDSREAV
jgi:hypothetical protein